MNSLDYPIIVLIVMTIFRLRDRLFLSVAEWSN